MKICTYLLPLLVLGLLPSASFSSGTSELDESRLLQFNDYAQTNMPSPMWAHEGPMPPGATFNNGIKQLLPGTNHYHRTGWVIRSARTGTSAGLSGSPRVIAPNTGVPVYPALSSNLYANLQNTLGATIESPVFTNGIGTVYFEAINSLQALPTQISVDIATNMYDVSTLAVIPTLLPPSTNGLAYQWEALDAIDLAAATSNDFTRYVRVLNARLPLKVRIRRSGTVYEAAAPDAYYTVVDNIRVSPPAEDVVVSQLQAEKAGVEDKVSCVISNAEADAGSTSRVVTVHYRWPDRLPPENVWTHADAARVEVGDGQGNGEAYEASLSPQPFGGNLEFYVTCFFDGCWYESPDYTGLGYASYPSEDRSPFTSLTNTQILAGMSMYLLTVNYGSGGGSYTSGAQVAIAATPQVGKAFARWAGDTEYVADATAPSTTVAMPDMDVEVTATFTNLYYTLAVTNGTGGGQYTSGAQVAITADMQAGKIFDRWVGDARHVADVHATNTTVTMPAADISVAATYLDLYTLTVNNGSGDGAYTNGTMVAISAEPPPAGQAFFRWTGDTARVANVYSPNTTVLVLGAPVALTATYIDVYELTVNSGTGTGFYTNGSVAAISAAAVPGKIFDRWTGDTSYVANIYVAGTTVTMPAAPVTVTATYLDVHVLTVNNGTGGGSYTNGQTVAVIADPPVSGQVFVEWAGATQYVANAFAPETQVTMPDFDIALTATYSNVIYTLTVLNGTGSGIFQAGQVVPISANVPAEKTFVGWWSENTAPIANPSSPNTTVTMPAANYTVVAVLSAHTSVLPESRFLHFNDYAQTNAPSPLWAHEGPMPPGATFNNGIKQLLPGTNHYHRTGWVIRSARAGTSAGLSGSPRVIPPVTPIPTYPALSSNLYANLQNTLGASIESPVFTNGVGTVYFEAINSLLTIPTQLTVELATNMVNVTTLEVVHTLLPPSTNGLDYAWQTVDVLDLDAATLNDFTRYVRLLNARLPLKVRIRRSGSVYEGTSADANYTVVDNIRVSPPPSDLVISQSECVSAPGYPAAGALLTIRCQVDNADQTVPTEWRALSVAYRWRYRDQLVDPWRTNAMVCVSAGDGQGNGEMYEAEIPPPPEAGDVEYFFIGTFEGYVYESPDYTGTGLNGYPYPSESRSPRVLRGEGARGEFSVRVRPHAASFGGMCVETEGSAGPIEMTLCGKDTWRGLVPLAEAGATNLLWRIVGDGEWEPGANAFSTNLTWWSDDGATAERLVPYIGACVVTNPTGWACAQVEGPCTLMITFDSGTGEYALRRAVFQDFNGWPAPPDRFTESNAQAAKVSLMNTFETWPTNQETVLVEPMSGHVASTNEFQSEPFSTPQGWVAEGAAYVSERCVDTTYGLPDVPVFRNLALRLKGGDGALGLGSVHSTVATRPDGLKDVRFKCRAIQGINSADVAYYLYGFTNENYLVRANVHAINAAGLSPESPSVSLVGYFTDPETFYEYRVVQIKDPADTASYTRDRRASHRIYKWAGGVPTLLASGEITSSYAPLTGISDTYPIEMRIYNVSPTQTRIRCKYGYTDNVVTVLDSASPYHGGTFGFITADCHACCSTVYTQPTMSDAYATGSSTLILGQTADFGTKASYWYCPLQRYEPRSDVSPKGIYSLRPTQQLGVYVQESDRLSAGEPNDNWRLLTPIAVTNFGYQAVEVPAALWRSHFVKLQAMGGSCDVAVDELAVRAWRAAEAGSAEEDQWWATESWVMSDGSNSAHIVQLDHARSDPATEQAIRSPRLENGLGLMEFDYRVRHAPATLTVQYALATAPEVWVDAASWTEASEGGWEHATVPLGLPGAGFFRLLHEREGLATNACIELDNIQVWNEPQRLDTSWWAYNAKITAADSARLPLDGSKVCMLNNSETADAAPLQGQHPPFVQAPRLQGGLGELSFDARAYDAGQPSTLSVCVSTNGWDAADDAWFEVYRFENISNAVYRTYTYRPVDGRAYDAVRLVNGVGGDARRICFDNVLASEPLLPAFDIVDVTVLCDSDGAYDAERHQPLVIDEVGFEARLANKRLDPSNIVMYVSYFVGTNVWGVGNWPLAQTVTLRLYPTPEDPDVFRTSTEEDIPALQANQVVQYVVWAEYTGGVPLTQRQRVFAPPPWYYPEDLNEVYGERGWSPYYVVYGAPQQRVWVNEINAVDYMQTNNVRIVGVWDNVYIELAVPADVDLAGWSLELVSGVNYDVHAFRFPDSLPSQEPVTNGYAFVVVGDEPDPNLPPLPKLDVVWPGLKTLIPCILPGGIRLRRPTGGYEQCVAYDWNAIYGTPFDGARWAASDPESRFVYVGRENSGGSLGRIGLTDGLGDWSFPQVWTPGAPNAGQAFPDSVWPVTSPSVSAVLTLSSLPETDLSGTGEVAATLSEPYDEDVWVRFAAPAGQGSIVFDAGDTVCVPAGETNSPPLRFSSSDGTPTSALSGIRLTPVVTNALPDAYFHRKYSAWVVVENSPPAIESPLASDTNGAPAVSVSVGTAHAFPWQVRDVAADAASLAVTWDFGDGATALYSNAVGEAAHAYEAPGEYVVTVTAADKDGGVAKVVFKVAATTLVLPVGVRLAESAYRPWLDGLGLGGADFGALDAARFDEAWLLDQNPLTFETGALAILELALSPSELSCTFALQAVTSEGTVAVSRVNGRLVMLGAADVGGPYAEVADVTSAVGAGSLIVPRDDGVRFYKLAVVFPAESEE